MAKEIADVLAQEAKWQERWSREGLFESEVIPGRPKYFVNFPYPYMNGLLHLGHTLTLTRVEVMARYKRMKGYNVLFPFAFHCTGTPIVAAAARVRDGEPKQLAILREMGIPEEEIPAFADPEHWTRYFPAEAKKDLQRLGISVDWRRSFITTSLNPAYDAFVRWQFLSLKEKGLVVQGAHPVVWCPKCNSPVGDHARLEGEGETPQEMVLLKFRMDDGRFLVASTLRPETVYGQTNLWLDPDYEYVEAEVDGEVWIVSRPAVEKLRNQKHEVVLKDTVLGANLLGTEVVAPGIHRRIPVLPSWFCDPEKGTGIVTSVPSDAPDDWMGLHDLQNDPAECERWGLDPEKVRAIAPIPIIDSGELGTLPAVTVCEEMGIGSQDDRDALLEAKKRVYKVGYYEGVMLESCGPHAGQRVEAAKDQVKAELLAAGEAALFYELTGPVVCRCLTPSVVKIVEDQWFIAYGNPEWKRRAHEGLARMRLFPEGTRKQFDYVIDWLNDWACTREFGLGTRLPWDERWVIESLSDSTLYMAYYTVAHVLEREGFPKTAVTPELFAYLFTGEGDPDLLARSLGVPSDDVAEMRRSFAYWYGFDFRGSGKDLIQNHLTFCLFNHVALLPPERWPKGFGTNGWLLVDGEKMSKSRGNFRTLREVVDTYGADVMRLTLMAAGEGVDDPNFDTEFAAAARRHLDGWSAFALSEHPDRGGACTEETRQVDLWFLSVLNRRLAEVRDAMEETRFRTALKVGFFDIQKDYKQYLRRAGTPNRRAKAAYIEAVTRILCPFCPHEAEEVWSALGKEGFVSTARWPDPDEGMIRPEIEAAEDLVADVLSDVKEILKVTQLVPGRVFLYTAPAWMRRVRALALGSVRDGRLDMGALMKAVESDPALRPHKKEVPRFAQGLMKDPGNLKSLPELDEADTLARAAGYLSDALGAPVEVYEAGPGVPDPGNRARYALPGRPAIYVLPAG